MSPTSDAEMEEQCRSHSPIDSVNTNNNLRIPKPEGTLLDEHKTTSKLHIDNLRPTPNLISVRSHPLMSPEPFNPPKCLSANIDSEAQNDNSQILKGSPSYTNTSSESELDHSQYQAEVEQSFQRVQLVQNEKQKKSTAKDHKEEQLSLENLSVHSSDDVDGASCLMSRSSSMSFGEELSTPHRPLNSLGSQIGMLSDGREIDMKVIEPYKRVLSHGGYLNKDSCQNAILIFSSCYLPDRSRTDYRYVMDSLFIYVIRTLEQLITEDYVLLYLHGGSCRRNVPSFPWLKKCYNLLDRKLRKSLKNVYMVHPTFWLKSIVWMSRPFISAKFWRKVVYVDNLEELYILVPRVERQAVPEPVKMYDISQIK